MTPCLGRGMGACPSCPVLSPAVLGSGRVGLGAGILGRQGQAAGLPWEWLLASYLLPCQCIILLLLVTSLMKLVFSFWDS